MIRTRNTQISKYVAGEGEQFFPRNDTLANGTNKDVAGLGFDCPKAYNWTKLGDAYPELRRFGVWWRNREGESLLQSSQVARHRITQRFISAFVKTTRPSIRSADFLPWPPWTLADTNDLIRMNPKFNHTIDNPARTSLSSP